MTGGHAGGTQLQLCQRLDSPEKLFAWSHPKVTLVDRLVILIVYRKTWQTQNKRISSKNKRINASLQYIRVHNVDKKSRKKC